MEAHTLEILRSFELFLEQESRLPLEARRAILGQLLESLKPPEFEEEAALELAAESGPYRGISRDLLRRDRFYAIQGDDLHLDLLKEAVTLSAALYAALQNPVAVLGGLVVVLYKYRRKQIPITLDQALVLTALRRAPDAGWTTGRLWHELPANSHLDQAKLLEILSGLEEVRAANGKVTALTTEKNGRWWVVDV
jgi:hypothetical protein